MVVHIEVQQFSSGKRKYSLIANFESLCVIIFWHLHFTLTDCVCVCVCLFASWRREGERYSVDLCAPLRTAHFVIAYSLRERSRERGGLCNFNVYTNETYTHTNTHTNATW